MILKNEYFLRISRSVGAEALGQSLNIGMRIILIPLFISAWGAEAYGEWLILTAVVAWFSLGDFGGQLYYVNRLTEEWAKKSNTGFQDVFSTGISVFLTSAVVIFSFSVAAIYFLPLEGWLNLKTISPGELNTITLLMVFRLLIALPIGLLQGIYRAIGFQGTSVMYSNMMLLIQFLASIYALLQGASMIWLALIEVAPFLLILPIILWDLKRRLPKEFELSNLSRASYSVFRESISPSIHFLALQLSMGMMIQGVILVIANVLGPIEVAIFSSMRIVANVMSRFMGMIANAAWPEVTKLAAAHSNLRLFQLFKIVQMLTLYFGACYLFLITNYGKELFEWWLRGGLTFDFWVMYFLVCQVLLGALVTWGSNILMATNNHEEFVRWQLVINLCTLVATYIGCLQFGMIGGVILLIATQFLPQAYLVYKMQLKNKFHLIAKNFLRTLIFAIVMLPIFLNIWSAIVVILLLTIYLVKQIKLSMQIAS